MRSFCVFRTSSEQSGQTTRMASPWKMVKWMRSDGKSLQRDIHSFLDHVLAEKLNLKKWVLYFESLEMLNYTCGVQFLKSSFFHDRFWRDGTLELFWMRCGSWSVIDGCRWLRTLTTARITRWGGMISTPDAVLQAVIKRALIESNCPSQLITELMENAHERRWPPGLCTLETRQQNRRLYETIICKRIPGSTSKTPSTHPFLDPSLHYCWCSILWCSFLRFFCPQTKTLRCPQNHKTCITHGVFSESIQGTSAIWVDKL